MIQRPTFPVRLQALANAANHLPPAFVEYSGQTAGQESNVGFEALQGQRHSPAQLDDVACIDNATANAGKYFNKGEFGEHAVQNFVE